VRVFPLAGAALIALAALPAAAQPIVPTTVTQGVVRYPWVDGVPARVYCTPGMTCDIGFEAGEEIQDVVCAMSAKTVGARGWIIDQGSQGSRPFIYVTGSAFSPTANLIVTTNRRRYKALLIAEPSAHLSYAIAARATDASPAPSSPTPVPSPTARAIDYDFDLYGNAPFYPKWVRREGDLTYIVLRDGLYAQPDVASYRVDDGHHPSGCPERDHQEARMAPVGYVPAPNDPHTLVVQGLYPALVVYSGDGANQRCFYVFRKGAQ
jgi:hypothetical protein